MPPIVDAYLEYLGCSANDQPKEHVDLQSAVCVIMYTLCKVRGYKVILGFFNNEPRYLEPILRQLEQFLSADSEDQSQWQVPYVLLLWLSHLLLTPFDLSSISNTPVKGDGQQLPMLPQDLPPIATRILRVGLRCLPMPTKAQDGAAMVLFRLVIRPDMQRIQLPDGVVKHLLQPLNDKKSDVPVTIYERLGPLRFLSVIASSAELIHLVPSIYRTCEKMFEDESSPVSSNAVAKKILVKTLRNVAILSLRVGEAEGPLLSFLQTTSVLEDVIDYLLRSLADRDTPVRYAAAKALSRIILELDVEMGHEVIQAILDTFKEDMPRQSEELDFSTANALKWHGLTLALGHTLFKRSASPEQLPDIINALTSALQFEQRTATGSSVGTNVRDAANFGIWSLSRRYTTAELLSVTTEDIRSSIPLAGGQSIIQIVATHLVLASCLDPVGNIRRGSSAALQELVGRHPNQVDAGISLVQIVDYQAVGLRARAMVDVADRAAELQDTYWSALINGMLGWRGFGSSDIPSREAAATGLAKLAMLPFHSPYSVLGTVRKRILHTPTAEVEELHGMALCYARLVIGISASATHHQINGEHDGSQVDDTWHVIEHLQQALGTFSTRVVRSLLPAATAQILSALCRNQLVSDTVHWLGAAIPFDKLDSLVERLLTRTEHSLQQQIPSMVDTLFLLKREARAPIGCLGAQHLMKKVAFDGSKSSLNGACGAIALGALAPLFENGLFDENAEAVVNTLGNLTEARNVDWRIVGLKALQLVVKGIDLQHNVGQTIVETIANAVHCGLNDYTIDERGDIGSLVRLQAISTSCTIFASKPLHKFESSFQILHQCIYRLSLEKLDRVRLEAARCRHQYLEDIVPSADIAAVSTETYFTQSIGPLRTGSPPWKYQALLEGCISCAGISAEPLLQASRSALIILLHHSSNSHLDMLMSVYATVLKSMLLQDMNMYPALELLGLLLDMEIPQRLAVSDFKWRNLLSTVQKSHHKSNDIPKILAALHVYRGLADIALVRDEVLKKLISMLKTNPYPRIRSGVAETLYIVVKDPLLKSKDWTRPSFQHLDVIDKLQKEYVKC